MIFSFEQRVWSAMQTLEDQVWAGKRIVVQLRAIWTVCVGRTCTAPSSTTLKPDQWQPELRW